jgi:hypothetical protein
MTGSHLRGHDAVDDMDQAVGRFDVRVDHGRTVDHDVSPFDQDSDRAPVSSDPLSSSRPHRLQLLQLFRRPLAGDGVMLQDEHQRGHVRRYLPTPQLLQGSRGKGFEGLVGGGEQRAVISLVPSGTRGGRGIASQDPHERLETTIRSEDGGDSSLRKSYWGGPPASSPGSEHRWPPLHLSRPRMPPRGPPARSPRTGAGRQFVSPS